MRALTIAARRLQLDRMGERQARAGHAAARARSPTPTSGSTGYDAAVLSEVIEHLDLPRLPALEYAVFGAARPRTVLVTTPNVEYNVRWETPARRARPPRRPPLRVDPRGVPRPGPTAVAERHGYDVRVRARRRRTTPRSGRPPRWPCSATHDTRRRRRRHDARHQVATSARHRPVPRRARRRLRLRQVHLRPPALQADRGASPPTSAAAWSPTTRTTRAPPATPSTSCTTSRASGSRPGRLTVVDATNVQPERRAPAGRAGPRARRAADRHRARRARGGVRRAQRGPPRPGRHAAPRHPAPAPRTAPLAAAAWSARASARCTSCAASEEIDAAEVVTEKRFNDRTRPHRPVRHHRRHPRLRAPSWRPCSASSAGHRRRRRVARTPRAVPPSSSATSSTAARTRPGVLRLRHGHGRGRQRAVRARQPREQAAAAPQGPQGPAHARPGRDPRAAGGTRPTSSAAEVRRVHRRARQPLRPRRRQARRLPRRAAGEVPRPHLGPGPLVRAVRRHHRRDRRVRPAGALPVGRGLPRPGDGRLRPHARARRRVGQQHHLPGHRLPSSAAS